MKVMHDKSNVQYGTPITCNANSSLFARLVRISEHNIASYSMNEKNITFS